MGKIALNYFLSFTFFFYYSCMSKTDMLYMPYHVFSHGKLRYVARIEIFLQILFLHYFLIFNVISHSFEIYKIIIKNLFLKKFDENFTTISFYIQLKLKDIITEDKRFFWALHWFLETFEIWQKPCGEK